MTMTGTSNNDLKKPPLLTSIYEFNVCAIYLDRPKELLWLLSAFSVYHYQQCNSADVFTLYNKMASSIFPFKNSIIVNVFYNFFEGSNNLNFEF